MDVAGPTPSADGPFAIVIDQENCVGHGRCFDLHPDMFSADDDGFPIVLAPTFPAERQRDAVDAVRECPERAITLAPRAGGSAGLMAVAR